MLLEKVALTLLAVLAVQAQGNMYSRFKSTKIISSNPDVVEVHKCYIKAYSRNYSTFNLALTFKKPQVKPFRVTIEIHYKYGTIYRTIFNQTIEWCTAAVGGDGASVLEKMVKGLIEDSAPALFHECPFYGPLNLFNLTFNDNNWISIIPSGVYRMEINVWNALRLQLTNEAVSDLKTSW